MNQLLVAFGFYDEDKDYTHLTKALEKADGITKVRHCYIVETETDQGEFYNRILETTEEVEGAIFVGNIDHL